jgi:hypothetical protein
VAGFLAPFISAGVTGLLILMGEEAFTELRFFIPYLFLVPAVLVAGLVLSIQSLSYVEELGDKDYAYSGLALNLFCLFFFVLSLVYVFRFAPG